MPVLELSGDTRRAHLERMTDGPLDVLVIGGGITGAGVALDAAARGLRVGLVERDDFASGTSGRSSRLIHGGIRYLRHAELGVVRDSLAERDLLLRLAPHLVRAFPLLTPVRGAVRRAVVKVGLTAYDRLAGRSALPAHRRVGPEEAGRLAPALAGRVSGYLSWDGRTDDARLTLEVIRQAAARGALVANHASVRALRGDGRVRGAEIEDLFAGGRLSVDAEVVVNATGAWADEVLGMALPRSPRLRPSKGVHIVVARERVPIRSGLLLPSLEGVTAFIFVVPWGPRVYAGTTDSPFEGDLRAPTVEDDEVEILLASLNRAVEADLGRGDVLASWAGIRPLLDAPGGSTRDLSRRHVVVEEPPGLVTVTGGKLTTYRRMAAETVDRVCASLGRGGHSPTAGLRLGLAGDLGESLARAEDAARGGGFPPVLGLRLVALYGDDWTAAMEMLRDAPALAEPLVPGLPVRAVEVEMARRREMALTPEDVLERRTRLTTMDARTANLVP